jgi:hypothetical protein
MFAGAERFFNDFADFAFAGLARVVAFDFGKTSLTRIDV